MDDERVQRVFACMAANLTVGDLPAGDALCRAAVEVLAVAGAGITLHGASGAPYSVGASGPDMATIHDLELTLGEGPCIDAYNCGEATSEPDLAHPETVRWPAFRSEALHTEARAAFGYPLRIGDARFGALNIYATQPGQLSEEQHLDALVVADLSIHKIIASFGGGLVGREPTEDELVPDHIEVHQATGMISVQLGIGVVDALARLRARAFAEGRPVRAVAADVVNRLIRFEP